MAMAQHPKKPQRWTIHPINPGDGEPFEAVLHGSDIRPLVWPVEVVPALTDEQRAWVEKRVKRAHPTDTVAASLADWLGS